MPIVRLMRGGASTRSPRFGRAAKKRLEVQSCTPSRGEREMVPAPGNKLEQHTHQARSTQTAAMGVYRIHRIYASFR